MPIHPIENRYGRKEAENAISSFQKWSKKKFGKDLTSIVLFGSFAKGTYYAPDFGSDIDILIILKSSPDVKSQMILFQPIILDALKEYKIRVSPIAISEGDFKEMIDMKFPLVLGILESYKILYDQKSFFTKNIKNLSSSMKNIKLVEKDVWYFPSLRVGVS